MTAIVHFSRQKSTELSMAITVFFLIGFQIAGAI